MYAIKIKADFSAAHRLQEAGGKCEELHGHNFIVEVVVESDVLNDQGMVMDFRDLKMKTRALLEGLDHRYLNELPPFQKVNPSAENLAAYLYAQLSSQIDAPTRWLSEIAVWESETSRASYGRPNR